MKASPVRYRVYRFSVPIGSRAADSIKAAVPLKASWTQKDKQYFETVGVDYLLPDMIELANDTQAMLTVTVFHKAITL